MPILPSRLLKWIARYTRASPQTEEPPLRAELFSVEQLARHARALATGHQVVTRRGFNCLLSRLDANEASLIDFNRITLAISTRRRVTPAAEWFLDNFYLVEEQIHLARRHLPGSYIRELPRLVSGSSSGLPRVYDIALELISHTDAQIDAGPLSAFVAAYQSSNSLKLGELWAIPIMLRLGLIENLQRITSRLTIARADRTLARLWVDRLQDVAEKNPSQLVIVVADMAKADLPVSSAFVSEFSQHLSQQSTVLHLARGWLGQRLSELGLSVEQLVQTESQNQAADQVSVSHSLESLRFLGSMNWKEFVETMSLVETTLRSDPADVYRTMDFTTRDCYRHSVEYLAKYSRMPESDVAKMAVGFAEKSARSNGPKHIAAHVGYYLIGKGKPELERALNVRLPLKTLPQRCILRFPLTYYIGGIAALTLLATALFARQAMTFGAGAGLISFSLVFLISVSQLAVAMMNRLSTLLVAPRLLPRLDYSFGIARESRTMVVVPAMLASIKGVDRLVESLEIHHLSNRDPHLHFALLTDFLDAPGMTQPGDKALLERVRSGIEALNLKYASNGPSVFFLFHRPRIWNGAEGVWMGYERKRGKLEALNAVLRGGSSERFSDIVGSTEIFPTIRYVITLDTDTQLPRDAARQLVGTMAHPLNRPVFDAARGVVSGGYGIMQPRVSVSMSGSRRSWFARLFDGEAGIDPYTREVSDVYQDVFHEGSFVGKGIYDVDAFRKAVQGRFPENAVLSHDLLESCYARCALVCDVELFERFPSRYNVDAARRYRWIRGDWQIVQWLRSRVPDSGGGRVATALSRLSQWKILDNLRRSVVPIAMMGLILGAWMGRPAFGCTALLLVISIIALPTLVSILTDLFRKPSDLPWSMHLREMSASGGRQLGQIFLSFAMLPFEAFISLDAIAKTLWRVFASHRRLLEWQTSNDSERGADDSLTSSFAAMWMAPAIALVSVVFLSEAQPKLFVVSLGFIALWCAAPWIAWRISKPAKIPTPDLTGAQLVFLRRKARRTWHYFETFVTARENWLPPDNFQEIPTPTVASRTSPTNMGFALLGNLAATDFGYITKDVMIRRTRDALATMQRMERYSGHFYNWYDTLTLQPLLPLYVSSVDSGNLAGYLLTLASGLREQADARIFSTQVFDGLRDTAGVLRTLTGRNSALSQFDMELKNTPATLHAAHAVLERAANLADRVVASLSYGAEESRRWSRILKQSCDDQLEELRYLAPWLQSADSAVRESGELDAALRLLDLVPTLREVSTLDQRLGSLFDERSGSDELSRSLKDAGERARKRLLELENLAAQCDAMAAMDFSFLYDPSKKLFSVGFNVTEHRRDNSFYDLLASEARVCSYVAVALGQVPQEHWFSMGRQIITSMGTPILLSWNGSMFEYLMPLLVMPNYENTLLDHSCKAAVQHQIDYGNLRDVPWGISESAYNRTDVHFNYQYSAFGVPGLGLRRGLADDLVIAPYATVMALMIAPREACENLQRLDTDGLAGNYGFYDAMDYTPSHLPPNVSSVIVRSFMAHHEGMSLLALANLICGNPMQRRFMACPLLRAANLLLQERVPKTSVSVLDGDTSLEQSRTFSGENEGAMRICTNPTPSAPELHLLSNGRYHVVITSAGGGYSRWRDISLTRWREDSTRDCWGVFVYMRDVDTGEYWSNAYQPTLKAAKGYEAIFTQARAEFKQRRDDLEIHTEICVSPEDDVELRRITITNRSSDTRVIELTSYAEVTLTLAVSDDAHPAFSNLFMQTEFARDSSALLCTRRARSPEERPPWMTHLMLCHNDVRGEISCETDREKFIGRCGTTTDPAAMRNFFPLSNTVGPSLDPIVSLRRTVSIPPHEAVVVDLVFGVAESREAVLSLVEKYQSSGMSDRAFDMAWTHSHVILRQLNANEAEAQLYGRLASALIYADPARRANQGILSGNRRGQSGLWSYGISGDSPIVLLRISDTDKIEIVRQLLQAHAYWRMKGLTVELVILNEDVSVYRQYLHDQITRLIVSGLEAQLLDKPGGVFVRRLEQISQEDRLLLQSVARIVLDGGKGSLAEQSGLRRVQNPPVPALVPTRSKSPDAPPSVTPRELIFQNGLGGFTKDGHEYVITLKAGQTTPAPWVNVIANQTFGTVVSESGAAYTWLENSHEFRLTPWSNDPVQDTTGEALYIRDEETGQFWSPTPLPARGASPYVIRHGFGYTVFEHTQNGIVSELWVYVAMDAPVKFSVLKVRNVSGRPRRVSLTGYWEWVMGELRQKNLLHVQTELDLRSGALLARNYYNTDFPDRIAFIDVNDRTRTVTGDRKEFIGRNGTLSQPSALKATRLSGNVGAGLDPCGAVQVVFDLADGQGRETTFRMGVGHGLSDVQNLIQRYRGADACLIALEGVWAYWNRTLGTVNVDTPDPSVNVLANGWLLYQTISCRLWGRTGFYQSGGAFGFRDQLQDVMALVHAVPALVRSHLLIAAAHQFREGDVQHWWHPPTWRGVRTHFSDDYLWLPYVACRYVSCVADTGILDEKISYLEARPVKQEEESYYDLPNRTEESATLYRHCVLAIEHGLEFGPHGLPLMGCGDWNDGMNRIGNQGRGESVWLAFFLYDVLTRFAGLARAHNDAAFAERCIEAARQLKANIGANAWDGNWYLRAFFDDGTLLGSHKGEECQIDSLPQSWSVISGIGSPERSFLAMQAVTSRLVHRDLGLIQLFDPPFDKSSLNPGYIKGYAPGVRENGGQYTHGAIWTILAFALMGESENAWKLFALINPINHSSTPEKVATYKVEPYVMAADVYAAPPYAGRGGWTWYTGSASWMYRLLVETLLGVNLEGGDRLRLTPRMPNEWTSFKIHYRYLHTVYHITVTRNDGVSSAANITIIDGREIPEALIPLNDDQIEHFVELKIG
jgi:cyclic beta-1,2-glucan synthetase